MKARQNAGTGSTAYSWGGLTRNSMSLINGPTWEEGGTAFDSASSQYGWFADFLGSETLTIFSRATITQSLDGIVRSLAGQYSLDGNNRSATLLFGKLVTLDVIAQLNRSSDGTSSNQEVYRTGDQSSFNADLCHVAQWLSGGGRGYWVDKSEKAVSLESGSPQTSKYNTSDPVSIGAFIASGGGGRNFLSHTNTATAFLTGTVTEAQQFAITDRINEL